jgi:hypothetical protein
VITPFQKNLCPKAHRWELGIFALWCTSARIWS